MYLYDPDKSYQFIFALPAMMRLDLALVGLVLVSSVATSQEDDNIGKKMDPGMHLATDHQLVIRSADKIL